MEKKFKLGDKAIGRESGYLSDQSPLIEGEVVAISANGVKLSYTARSKFLNMKVTKTCWMPQNSTDVITESLPL